MNRKDLKAKKWIDAAGALLAFIGLGGMAGAAEGQGNIVIAVTVFVVGFSICLWGYKR